MTLVSEYSFTHNNIETDLSVKPISSRIGVYDNDDDDDISSRIGVFVDHGAGTLSFYSVSDTMSLIHSPDHIHSDALSWVLCWFWIISETVLMNQNRLTRDSTHNALSCRINQ